jgi:hypothetical protein
MRLIDFSSWQGVLSTLTALVIVTVIAVGIRLLVMRSACRTDASARTARSTSA